MGKRVLSVGQCGPDHFALTRFLRQHFAVEIVPADLSAAALEQLRKTPFDLVLVNRKLDADYSDGLEVIRSIKADPALASIPVMLVTNYPEHQQAAVAIGALPGFGKLEYDNPETLEKLRHVLAR
jgi:CheY-like chemotaxis protein